MKQLDDADWNEINDRGIVDWRRVRSAIEHENELTNHRLTWLLTQIAVNDVRQSPLGDIGVSGTPTLILVDNHGVAQKVWLGKLPEGAQSEVSNNSNGAGAQTRAISNFAPTPH